MSSYNKNILSKKLDYIFIDNSVNSIWDRLCVFNRIPGSDIQLNSVHRMH